MSRHAAPMQNLVLPLSLAIRAAESTESTVTILDALRPVWYLEDWAHCRDLGVILAESGICMD